MTTSPRTCGPRLGHVFPPDAIAGTPCACGLYLRNDSARGMVRATPAPGASPRRTIHARARGRS